MKAKNIIWDTDGDKELREELPKEMEFPDELYDADDPYYEEICDYLSDQTGFCIESYEIELPGPAGPAPVKSTDFAPRQTAYIVTLDGAHSGKRICKLQECIVMSAGSRFVKTMPDIHSPANKKFANFTGKDEYLTITLPLGGNTEMLFPTKKLAEEYIERREDRLYIRSKLLDGQFIDSLTLEQLRKIKAVLTA